MARPSKCRLICSEPDFNAFTPQGIPDREPVNLSLDEYEAIRLIDLERYTQEECAAQMEVARTTVTALYESARYKIADSIVNGKKLLISGGHYRLCDGSAKACCRRSCCSPVSAAPIQNTPPKGANAMRVAVTYDNGNVFQHFGHTEQFKIYDVENGKITNEQVVATNGQGHGALAQYLSDADVNVLICGGIGGGAQMALAQAGIQLFGGVSGSADDAVRTYIAGSLDYDPDVHCDHHDSGHSCGSGSCGENRHGCSGS
jgi:predicted DNA-binding protein (UPF0251 family)/predicted Fe-Mo cluster-binding NifX family protein